MTDTKDNSSLPLLLSLTGAILLVAVGGWFYLDQDAIPAGGGDRAGAASRTAGMVNASPAPATEAVVKEEESSDEAPAPVVTDEEMTPEEMPAPAGVETELRMARMAADSDVLVFPQDQSALHYYGLVLAAEPNNAIAIASSMRSLRLLPKPSRNTWTPKNMMMRIASPHWSRSYDPNTP